MSHPDFEGFDPDERRAIEEANAELLAIEAITADNIDLRTELIGRYVQARLLLEESKREPLGQRAAMLRVATDIIKELVKTKTDLYNAERLVALEETLIEVLQDFPDMKGEFLRRYELALKKAQ